jgi:ATP-binding cassette subfamily B multidrug efflux pump
MKHALSSIKRLARYIRPYRVTFYLVILFTILTVVLNAIMPYVTGLPTTEISKNVAEGMPINFDYILKYLIWLLVVGVGYCLAQFLSGFMMTNVVQQSMRDLRRDIDEKINRLPVSYFDKNQQGKHFISCN